MRGYLFLELLFAGIMFFFFSTAHLTLDVDNTELAAAIALGIGVSVCARVCVPRVFPRVKEESHSLRKGEW